MPHECTSSELQENECAFAVRQFYNHEHFRNKLDCETMLFAFNGNDVADHACAEKMTRDFIDRIFYGLSSSGEIRRIEIEFIYAASKSKA